MKIELSHPYQNNIEIAFNGFNQVVGSNSELKHYVWQLLNWYFGGKKYSESDLDIFDQIEPEILIDDELVKRSAYRIISITNVNDLIEELSFKKGSVAYQYFKTRLNSIETMEKIEKISDLIEMISQDVNQTIDLENQGLRFQLQAYPFNLDQLLSKNISPSLSYSDKQISFELANNEGKFILFLDMLEKLLAESSDPVLLILKNLDDFLSYDSFTRIFLRIESLTKELELKVINFPSNEGYLYLNQENIEGVTILAGQNHILDDLDFMYNRFKVNYPSTVVPSQSDFLKSLERIAGYLFMSSLDFMSLSEKDLVAIVLLNQLYQFDRKIKYCYFDIDPMEKGYLAQHIDRNS